VSANKKISTVLWNKNPGHMPGFFLNKDFRDKCTVQALHFLLGNTDNCIPDFVYCAGYK